MAVVLGSCISTLSLLQEEEDQLKIIALQKLNEPGVVEMFWTEIADYLAYIEVLHEDEAFPQRELAALVAAKVYYHLDESNDALRLALRAGSQLNLADTSSSFVRAIIAYAVDKYIALKNKSARKDAAPEEDNMSTDASDVDMNDRPQGDSAEDIAAIEALIAQLHANCIANDHLTYALGIALESEDISQVRAILQASPQRQFELLAFILEQAPRVVSSAPFRTELMGVVARALLAAASLTEEDLLNPKTAIQGASEEKEAALLSAAQGLSTAFLRLSDAASAAALLVLLTHGKSVKLHCAAIQVAFDLYLADQAPFTEALLQVLVPKPVEGEAEEVALEESEESLRLKKVVSVLQGAEWSRMTLNLLAKNNHTDLGIFDRLRTSNVAGAMTHNAIVVSHALAQAGTTNDTFLRVQIEWLGKAQCWNKFTATASMGVVHMGHHDGRKMLSKYLPPEGATGDATGTTRSAYAEAGAFYALGLIHASAPHTKEAVEAKAYLLQQLKDNHTSEIRLHGACLGLGLLSVGSADVVTYEALKTVLYTDMAVAGEAAALAIGLLMQGSNNEEAIQALHAYSHESPHEKIVRACALALGLIVCKAEEKAEPLLDTLMADQDAAVRYGGVLACGLAYAATSSLVAQRRLLKASVSDVSEDVRRGAVVALGFVLADRPHKVAESLKLICENYSFQVRYGAAIALGIGCAGSFNKEAVDLLMQLRTDPNDVVRQAAGISLGLVLMNATDAHGPKVAQVREDLLKSTTVAKESQVAKMGAVIGIGLMNAAGRNGTSSFVITAPTTSNVVIGGEDATEAPTGQVRFRSLAGMFLLSQLWYWYPLALGGALAIRPSMVVGVTADATVPAEFSVRCAAAKERLAYPENIKKEEKEKLEKVSTAVLSVSKKTDEPAAAAAAAAADEEMKPSEEPQASPVLTAQGAPAKKYETLSNGSRVLPGMSESVVFIQNARFVPLFAPNPASKQPSLAGTTYPIRKTGAIVLLDTKPEAGEFEILDKKPVEVPSPVTPAAPGAGATVDAPVAEEEAPIPIPEDFEWDGN